MPAPPEGLKNAPYRPKLIADSPRAHRVAVVLANAPRAHRKILQRAFSGRSLAAGVKAKCLECCCHVRAEIRECVVLGCPLWAYRPFQVRDGEVAAQ